MLCVLLLSSNATIWEDAHAMSGSLAVTVVRQMVEQVSLIEEEGRERGRGRKRNMIECGGEENPGWSSWCYILVHM